MKTAQNLWHEHEFSHVVTSVPLADTVTQTHNLQFNECICICISSCSCTSVSVSGRLVLACQLHVALSFPRTLGLSPSPSPSRSLSPSPALSVRPEVSLWMGRFPDPFQMFTERTIESNLTRLKISFQYYIAIGLEKNIIQESVL